MYLDYHTHTFDKDKDVKSIVNQYPLTADTSHFFSVGIHPWHIHSENLEAELEAIRLLAKHSNCCAIGECGLDRLADTSFELQIEVFKKQIILSEEFQKPLTIHCVKAYSEVLALKKSMKPTQRWIIHGFRKNWKTAESLLKNEIGLSFGETLLYDENLQEVFKKVSENQCFLETDDADCSIKEIYKKAQQLRG